MQKLLIFGVGLIGGSLARALKTYAPAQYHIIGFDRDAQTLAFARDNGMIDEIGDNLALAVPQAQMIVLASPVAQTAELLARLLPYLTADTVISDVGSTKQEVLAVAQKILGQKAMQFVGAHPIAGAEKSGVRFASADLFQGKPCVLTPEEHTATMAQERVASLWQSCGAQIMLLSAVEHDHIFASVSHLPHLAAFALVHSLAQRDNAETLLAFAASGFRDFTRIAASSPEMWRDIALSNRMALSAELHAYQAELAQLASLLEQADGAGLLAFFQQASALRQAWKP